MKIMTKLLLIVYLCVGPGAIAADLPSQDASAGFAEASDSIQKQLNDSLKELAELRKQIEAETVPLNQELSAQEEELSNVRRQYQDTTRLLDSRTLDLSNLRSENKNRKEEATYLSNLLGEYIRNFESRLHIVELQRYSADLEKATLAAENTNLSEEEIYKAQAELLSVALERLHEDLGGTTFDGTATDANGSIQHGTFVLIGPAAMFQSDDGAVVGTAEQRLGSLEPTTVPFGNLADTDVANEFFRHFKGVFPLDPTLGSAHKIEQTKQTIFDEFEKGGLVMYVIAGLAALVILVILIKFLHLFTISTPSLKKLRGLLQEVAAHNVQGANEKVKKIRGPVGRMLRAGVEHLNEPKDLVEEVMYEKMMATQLRLKSLLPFVAFGAASAPLLGLLGTVTGIINTFQLITVFGSGDVKSLSGGISEALITTKYGLVVAIPSLLFHTLLSRKARSIVNEMEKAAVALVNQLGKTPYCKQVESTDITEQLSVEQIRQLMQNAGSKSATSAPTVAQYDPDSAGSRMDSKVLSVVKASTVADAINKIRTSEVGADVDSIFVIDDRNKYVGHILVRHLLTRPEQTPVETIADPTPLYVRVDSHHNEVQQRFRDHDLIHVPVLDHDDRLVGCVKRNGNGDI